MQTQWKCFQEYVQFACVSGGIWAFLHNPISCRKDVVYRVQQPYAGSSTASMKLSSIVFLSDCDALHLSP